MQAMGPLIRALLVERFGLKYHAEERQLTAYTLVAKNPKLKKADPESRSWCKQPNPPVGSPPATRVLSCQNVTTAQFAERLQYLTNELGFPVLDATGLEGGWDVTLTFQQNFGIPIGPRPGEGMPGVPGAPSVADPTGGVSVFQAMEKLGLKLESGKRALPVTVIDHLEQKPTEN
jgi:uncharacterized protein (TIGR03435 family)